MNYTGSNTYQYTVGDKVIEFTSIPAEFSERAYNAIQGSDNPFFLEFLFNRITKEKYAVEDLEAGLIITVIFSALKLSGTIKEPVDIPDKIEKGREDATNSLYTSVYSSIARTLSGYKLEDLKLKTLDELIELLVFAEKVQGKEIFDTVKLRASFQVETAPTAKSAKKGAAAVSREDIDFLNQLLSREERDGPGF
jgi:hypothetical protein